jgi:hypothetical protein
MSVSVKLPVTTARCVKMEEKTIHFDPAGMLMSNECVQQRLSGDSQCHWNDHEINDDGAVTLTSNRCRSREIFSNCAKVASSSNRTTYW